MHRLWDKIGIFLSAICLVHCLIIPLIGLLLPSLTFFADEEQSHLHIYLAVAIWPTALMAFIPAYKHHKKKWILILGFSGLIFLTASLLGHHFLSENVEIALSVIGSFVLVYAHYQNFICNRCNSCHTHESKHSHS